MKVTRELFTQPGIRSVNVPLLCRRLSDLPLDLTPDVILELGAGEETDHLCASHFLSIAFDGKTLTMTDWKAGADG